MALNKTALQEEVIKYIIKTLKDKLSIDIDLDTNGGENFFSSNIGLSAKDMVYLLFLSEEYYNICFTEDEIDSLAFYTLYGLSSVIVKYITNIE